MNKDDIANYSAVDSLRNGREVTIRAIRPDDRGQFAGALRELSSESFYRRTFSSKRELSETDLEKLTEVDFKNVVALVAVMNEEGQERIVGGGRYIHIGDAAVRNAEVAFLVDDAHQGMGIGSRIFRHLLAIARTSGIAAFEAEVLPSNEGMLRLFDRSGLPVTTVRAEDTVHVTVVLTIAEKDHDALKKQQDRKDLQDRKTP
ncbi:MAG: GNAT family N-acetyltransferase [Nitrospirae bacterium]|nr:GNAT family N-acetyltransferase [Nitrospirota bacterium]NTW65072.1 GNAT family N-acetyltransferase [Nitrospirota bacterium]